MTNRRQIMRVKSVNLKDKTIVFEALENTEQSTSEYDFPYPWIDHIGDIYGVDSKGFYKITEGVRVEMSKVSEDEKKASEGEDGV